MRLSLFIGLVCLQVAAASTSIASAETPSDPSRVHWLSLNQDPPGDCHNVCRSLEVAISWGAPADRVTVDGYDVEAPLKERNRWITDRKRHSSRLLVRRVHHHFKRNGQAHVLVTATNNNGSDTERIRITNANARCNPTTNACNARLGGE